MAITRIREIQAKDSDFLSEQELADMKGASNGIAPLDSSARVPLINMPLLKNYLPYSPPNIQKILGTDGNTIFWTTDLLGGGVSASEPYYFDSTRNRYLSFRTEVATFYLEGTNRKNIYMYNTPNIYSSLINYKVDGEYCLVGYQFYSTTSEISNVIDVFSNSGSLILPITLPTSTMFYSNDSINIIIADKGLSAYIKNNSINTPVLKLFLKKTFYPV